MSTTENSKKDQTPKSKEVFNNYFGKNPVDYVSNLQRSWARILGSLDVNAEIGLYDIKEISDHLCKMDSLSRDIAE